MSQSIDATDSEVDSQANAWDFSDELLGNSIDSLGSGYQHPILELSDCDSKVLFLVHCWRYKKKRDGYSKG